MGRGAGSSADFLGVALLMLVLMFLGPLAPVPVLVAYIWLLEPSNGRKS